MATMPTPISPGDQITAAWLNNVAQVASGTPFIKGKGYADASGLIAFGGKRTQPFQIILARTVGTHAPGATQAVNKCGDDFVALDPVSTENAVNDSQVTIPDDTKLYVAYFANKWRVIAAFICAEE